METPQSTLEAHKASVRRAYEVGINERRSEVFDEVFAPDYVGRFRGVAPTVGRDAFKAALLAFLDAFPGIQFKIVDILAEGDRVAAHWEAAGTHSGTYRGFPPTMNIPPSGKHMEFSAIDIYRFKDGLIAEEWNTLDQLDLLSQMGVSA